MFKKLKYGIAAVALFAACTPAKAGEYVTGEVINVSPMYHSFLERNPQKVCGEYMVTNRQGSASGDVLTGMIVGGLLGKGLTGNDRGAATGAVFGGLIGADKFQNRPVYNTTQRRCSVQYNEIQVQKVIGYQVTVKVEGQLISVQTQSHPGQYMQLYRETTYVTQ